MDFTIRFLSFFVVEIEGKDEQANKRFKHYQTLDQEEFEQSELKDFLDGELKKSSNEKSTDTLNLNKYQPKLAGSLSNPVMNSIQIQTTIYFIRRDLPIQKKYLMNAVNSLFARI